MVRETRNNQDGSRTSAGLFWLCASSRAILGADRREAIIRPASPPIIAHITLRDWDLLGQIRGTFSARKRYIHRAVFFRKIKAIIAHYHLPQKGINNMRSHLHSGFIAATAAALLMSSAAVAQTAPPSPAPAATTVTATTTTVTATSWMTQEAPGQWRTSKLIGLNVYNNDNEKIGGISELIVDRAGKIEAVVVGAGGFLGLGEHDVAVPYAQINWAYQPVTSSRSAIPPVTTGAAGAPSEKPDSSRSYPDHAVLNMTKVQLAAAPEFKYSR
jgi:sporulation protein YlmC with PRC-barrel domain